MNWKGKFDLQKSDEIFLISTGSQQASLLSPFLWNVMTDHILRLPFNHDIPGLALEYVDDIEATQQHKAVANTVSLVQTLINYIWKNLN
jgi:hypothetical protein